MVNATTDGSRDGLFEAVVSDLEGPVLVTTSTVDDVAGVVAALESEATGDVRLLVDEETGKAVADAFLLASRTVDRVDDGALSVRVATPQAPFPTVLVGDDSVRSVAAVADAVTEMRADADAFSARVPPYSQMLSTLGQRVGEEMRDDVERAFQARTHGRRDSGDVRPVRLTLLVGAKNQVQFYELGLWGESEGVASRAKFSREKQTLEEHGLIDTEKVPTDVGRPRQRLVLADRLAETDPPELVRSARELLPE